jgi:hypothetical protein
MARPEVTGKRVGTTPVKPKRSAGPPVADDDAAVEPGDDDAGEAPSPASDDDAIEPRDEADRVPSPVSDAHRARGPPPPEATPESEVKEKPQVKLVRVLATPLAFSVEEFCKAHGISIGHFYALLKAGLGPRVMKVGLRTLISAEEAARWRAERTAETPYNEKKRADPKGPTRSKPDQDISSRLPARPPGEAPDVPGT